jgi:hypothetical protein
MVSTATSREQILAALFALVSTAEFSTPIMTRTTWQGKARKFVVPTQIPNDVQPFLAQSEGLPEEYERGGNRLPAIRTLSVRLFCWARVDSTDTAQLGSQYLTTMIEAVENALLPDTKGFGAPGLLTLGGLVQWCRIEGTILKFPGDVDNQALACIPVKILWP